MVVPALTKPTVLLLMAGCLLPVAAHAQGKGDFPNRPLRLVVPFAAGGSNDIIARVLGARLADAFGQTVLVDNRPGAGGLLGAEIVARAPPDGYNLMVHSASFTTSVAIQPKLAFDPLKDLQPVTQLGAGTLVMAVPAGSTAKTMGDLIALARAKPGSLNFGSAGTGTVGHLGTEVLGRMARIEAVHVPYKGLAPAVAALVGGQLQYVLGDIPTILPQVKAGKLRFLGVSGDKRSPYLPDVPTIGETVAGYRVNHWWGLFVPGGTPRPVVMRLNEEVAKILRTPEMRDRFDAEGAEAAPSSPEAFTRFVHSEIAFWRKVVLEGGFKPD
ncbi:MAG: tripartite tricarboxylate transporter substrate binding protein [bacterium]|jgi:tripartite-type tricarboxylate transporter receptor subunit TctC|nr:tripartite tricarboxylate transporter substrate binding protein [Betaproteobacteria bacterium]